VVTGSYITQARTALLDVMGETEDDHTSYEQRQLDLITLLVLVKGEECSAKDVYDAWAVARQREHPPGYDGLPPFNLLNDAEVLYVPYRDAIRMVARQLGDAS